MGMFLAETAALLRCFFCGVPGSMQHARVAAAGDCLLALVRASIHANISP